MLSKTRDLKPVSEGSHRATVPVPCPRAVGCLMVGGAALIAALGATGVTYAATSGTPKLHACANSAGVLALLNSKGKCPSGFTKVTLNAQGVAGSTGPAGPRGLAGPSGASGAQGPAAISGNAFSVSGSYETNNTNSLLINTSTTGQVSAHLFITSGNSVASVDAFLTGSTTTHCEAHAVGVPSA
jgi:hypothetical protein